jgi:superfamily II DNA or RNA helicase
VTYEAFLASKKRRSVDLGHDVGADEVHPTLFEWQRAIVQWAIKRGRAAIFADCGLGKTFMQLEWARLSAERTLILAPLSVARQTAREAVKIGTTARYVRDPDDVVEPGIYISNYEMAHHFDPSAFDAVVLDESSILKNVDGPTRRRLTDQFAHVPHRLACTATPAPNDVAELCNHAEFLGILPRSEMLASFFVHDDDGWRIKGHASEPMHEWMGQWAVALRRPSDLGWPDDGYLLPPMNVHAEVVDVDIEAEGQLFATDLGGVGGRSKVRRHTLADRCDRAIDLVRSNGDQWIVWCGLNDEATAIARAVPDAVNVDGATSPDDKAEALEAFQDGVIRVLVTKASIAGFGMNFQQCHRMAFVGMSDSYESYYQAVRRCWRFGQTEPVDVHIVVSNIERQIVDNVRRKETEASSTTDALIRHSPIRKVTDDSDAAVRDRRGAGRPLAAVAG